MAVAVAGIPVLDSFLAIAVSVVLIYVPHALKIAAIIAKSKEADNKTKKAAAYDLRQPRVSAKEAQDLTPAGLYIARAQGAHENGFETFTFLVAAILMSRVSHVDRSIENLVGTIFVVARVMYIWVYINNTSVSVASIRSLLWFIQLAGCGYLMYLSTLNKF